MYSLVTPKFRNPRKQARPVKRSRVQVATAMVPRSLKFDGECRLTRNVHFVIETTAGAGFQLGASQYQEVLLTYSPTAVSVWGSNVNYAVHGITNINEMAALWDRVKIEKVELSIISNVTDPVGLNTGRGPDAHAPFIIIGNDVNGPTNGTTSGTPLVDQLSGTKTYKLGGDRPIVKWTCKNPKYQRLIQYTSINSANEPATGYVQADTDIPHYGTRIGLQNAVQTAGNRLLFNAKFFFHCKNLK